MQTTETATTTGKFRATLAASVASSLIGLIEPYCLPGRCVVAGSLRRGAAEVSDVEICYVSRVGDVNRLGEMFPSEGQLADVFINELLVGKLAQRLSEDDKPTWGPLNKLALHRASGLPVDLFREPDPADWWRTLVIRTGPKDFNLKLIAGAKANGFNLHAYAAGLTRIDNNESVPVESEQHFLELCGFPWISPEDRR
jgi:DNA polymerase/3'-5' exonuclease PolX